MGHILLIKNIEMEMTNFVPLDIQQNKKQIFLCVI